MKPERLALAILLLICALTVLGVILAWKANQKNITLHARMAENGGWSPAAISARVGEPIHLRLTSDDVTHSFAVGQMDWPAVDVFPGEVAETVLTFDKPGKYVFYCTRWCGANHWRMRGTIEVTGTDGIETQPSAGKIPLYVNLGLDIDAPHPASAIPGARPSADQGIADLAQLPAVYRSIDYQRSHSPEQVWQALRQETFSTGLSDQQVWNLVAAIWRGHTSTEQLNLGAELYAQNCAPCHGIQGGGDGVFANQTGGSNQASDPAMSGRELEKPTDFTDPSVMLGASPALLQGKIMRGGMGTGMPYWGPIFTEEQIWAIVDYLYTFQFEP